MHNSESLENSRDQKEIVREAYASLFLNAMCKAITEARTGIEMDEFEKMDEEVLCELDRDVEETVEELFPDLLVRRIAGLKFVVLDRDTFEEKFSEE